LGELKAQQLEVYVDYRRFGSPDNSGYLEVYLQFNASSVWLERDSVSRALKSKILVTEIVRQGDKIVAFSKREISSPAMTDSTVADFYDQQRFKLAPGKYELEISCLDLLQDSAKAIEASMPVQMEPIDRDVFVSDIQLLEGASKATTIGPLTKSGFDIVPFVSDYYPPEVTKIAFYFELYCSKSFVGTGRFLLTQKIVNARTQEEIKDKAIRTRMNPKDVTPVMNSINIADLPSGAYQLVVEVRDSLNSPIHKRVVNFVRNNPDQNITSADLVNINIQATFVERIKNSDTLNDYISCLRPIASMNEIAIIDTIVKSNNMQVKKQFFYYFWLNRNATDPEYSWLGYKEQVDKVEAMYGTQIKKGYETDRGYVYLKYGPPDWLTDRPNEPSSYPYQIWQYKKAGKYNNKRFIFYLPDLVTNDYVLLHSDVPGEVKNARWQYMLNSRNSTNTDLNSPTGSGNTQPQWGNNASEYYKNPR
jgi:GWxTD domain-containing protein